LLQLIALMGVRKLMDFVFSPLEMYWLDHMLPGEDRVKKEDEQVTQYSIKMSLHCVPFFAVFNVRTTVFMQATWDDIDAIMSANSYRRHVVGIGRRWSSVRW